jgi:hypothetical protein
MRNMRREDCEGISERFVNPGFLPPTRSSSIQGGRFVEPAANKVLPPVRKVRLESEVGVNFDEAYHFSSHFRKE